MISDASQRQWNENLEKAPREIYGMQEEKTEQKGGGQTVLTSTGWPIKPLSTADLPVPCTNQANTRPSIRHHKRKDRAATAPHRRGERERETEGILTTLPIATAVRKDDPRRVGWRPAEGSPSASSAEPCSVASASSASSSIASIYGGRGRTAGRFPADDDGERPAVGARRRRSRREGSRRLLEVVPYGGFQNGGVGFAASTGRERGGPWRMETWGQDTCSDALGLRLRAHVSLARPMESPTACRSSEFALAVDPRPVLFRAKKIIYVVFLKHMKQKMKKMNSTGTK
jgi:hypothetical protein